MLKNQLSNKSFKWNLRSKDNLKIEEVTLDEKLYLKNPEFVLGIDLSFQAYVYSTAIKESENEGSYYWFLRPNSAQSESKVDVFKTLKEYVLKRTKKFHLKVD